MKKFKLSLFRKVEHHAALCICTAEQVLPTFLNSVEELCSKCNVILPEYFKNIKDNSILALSWIDSNTHKHVLAYHKDGNVFLCILREADSLKKDTIFTKEQIQGDISFNYCNQEDYNNLLKALDFAVMRSRK